MNDKRLYRSRTDRMIGGVCGGVGAYLNLDPTIVRLLFVLLTLTPANGVLIYLVMLLVTPLEP